MQGALTGASNIYLSVPLAATWPIINSACQPHQKTAPRCPRSGLLSPTRGVFLTRKVYRAASRLAKRSSIQSSISARTHATRF